MDNKQEEKRTHNRFKIDMRVLLRWSDEEPTEFRTRDMSDTGLFIITGPKPFPAEGTEVFVKLMDPMIEGETPWVKAVVARIDPEGVGIQLLDL